MNIKRSAFNTYITLRRNIDDIMCGEYDDVIHIDDLEKSKHIGFLLNNFTIDLDNNKAIFDYENIIVEVGGDMNNRYDIEFESYMINVFIKQDDFLRAYELFESKF